MCQTTRQWRNRTLRLERCSLRYQLVPRCSSDTAVEPTEKEHVQLPHRRHRRDKTVQFNKKQIETAGNRHANTQYEKRLKPKTGNQIATRSRRDLHNSAQIASPSISDGSPSSMRNSRTTVRSVERETELVPPSVAHGNAEPPTWRLASPNVLDKPPHWSMNRSHYAQHPPDGSQ